MSTAALALAACSGTETSDPVVSADASTDTSTATDANDAARNCPTSLTECEGTCRDTRVDRANCGACGTTCAAGEICSNGTCSISCGSGLTQCSDTCRDTQTDRANCGACGTACAVGQVCSAGTCALECAAPLARCGGDGDAGSGAAYCANTQSDRANCGTCGTACAAGEVCMMGKCELNCAAGQTACGGRCVDVQSDRAHCGACGTVCAAGEVCTMGKCALSCAAPLTTCAATVTGDAGGDGGGAAYCANTTTDRLNCGTCGTTCAAGEICVAGACKTSCASGTSECSGSCRDLQNDPSNCGGCGTTCAAGQSCVSGTCTLVCSGGATKCGSACVDTTTSAANCGTCGNACPAGLVCNAGACALACSGGSTKCGSSCTVLASDPANCGACGTTCPARANAAAACVSSSCRFACNSGFADCNTVAADGCEAELQSDALNCGACGVKCAAGVSCRGGQCVQGHAVLMGHDLFERSPDVDRLLGNAVFLTAQTGTVNILEYNQYADIGGEYANGHAAIVAAAAARGRTVAFSTLADYTQLATRLAGQHVLVVYEQETVYGSELTTVGTAWASTLASFVNAGGVVVVMDHNGCASNGTYEVLNPSGLITVSGASCVSSYTMTTSTPTDAVAAGMPSPYAATNGTRDYATFGPASAVVVARSSAGRAVVLHRTF